MLKTRIKMVSNKKKLLIFFAVLSVVVVVVILAVTFAGSSASNNNDNESPPVWKQLRLSRDVIPNDYRLSLDVYVDDSRYNGTVNINVSVFETTNIVRIHKLKLDIKHTSIQCTTTQSNQPILIKKTFDYLPNEFWVIETKESLIKGEQYEIVLHFNAILSDELNGFYRGSYQGADGTTRKFASTFFSPISARKAFPCFDEPLFKAVFQLTLSHENHLKALANMPELKSVVLPGKRIRTEFEPSLLTSTYILCWVVTDFHSLRFINAAGGLNLTGWTPLNKNVTDLEYGLNVTNFLLHRYEKYFNIDFPLKKLDILTLPAFAPSAMENWGLILFRNSKFLSTPSSTIKYNKQISKIMGHELVHQWFGNLATMKFWNDAWLKEGSFLLYKICQ